MSSLNGRLVGQETSRHEHHVDARWAMAYAAGINDQATWYLDTANQSPVIAHPIFPSCLEWPVILEARQLPGTEELTAEGHARNVHAWHDMSFVRPLRAGETYVTQGTVIALERRSPGAFLVIRLDTVDADGELVCRTFNGSIYRGIDVIDPAPSLQPLPEPPTAIANTAAQRLALDIPANAAHVYTECARIWNPIHTDRGVALAAGLPDIILHGTATLAIAVSSIIHTQYDGDPRAITRLGCRFTGMVLMPSCVELQLNEERGGVVGFAVENADGKTVIANGFIERRN